MKSPALRKWNRSHTTVPYQVLHYGAIFESRRSFHPCTSQLKMTTINGRTKQKLLLLLFKAIVLIIVNKDKWTQKTILSDQNTELTEVLRSFYTTPTPVDSHLKAVYTNTEIIRVCWKKLS